MTVNRSFFASVVSVATVGLLLSGCAQVHSGSAQRDPGFDPNAVVLNLLDPGDFPTAPRAALGAAGSFQVGREAEARRVADYTVLPFQVDPTLNHSKTPSWLKNEKSLALALGNEAVTTAADGHRFVSGFEVTATDKDFDYTDDHTETYVTNIVAVFAGADDAAAAAPGIIATAPLPPVDDFSRKTSAATATTIPRYPDTRAWVYQETPTDRTSTQVVQAFTVHGPYLLAQIAKTPTTAASAELVAAILDRQGPLIDTFAPTPFDQLAALPVDATGLWARLQLPQDSESTGMEGVYGGHAAVAFYDPPDDYQRIFTETGMDLLGIGAPSVLRTRDPAAAAALRDFLVADYTKNGYEPIEKVPGLPGSQCLHETAPSSFGRTECLATAGRYVIDAWDMQENRTKQRLAAQYLMLTAS